MLSHTTAEGSRETQPSGGKSLLVDGFRAAKILGEESPKALNQLRNRKLVWHASGNEGVTITPETPRPVIEYGTRLGPDSRMIEFINRIRWNNDDRGGKLYSTLVILFQQSLVR